MRLTAQVELTREADRQPPQSPPQPEALVKELQHMQSVYDRLSTRLVTTTDVKDTLPWALWAEPALCVSAAPCPNSPQSQHYHHHCHSKGQNDGDPTLQQEYAGQALTQEDEWKQLNMRVDSKKRKRDEGNDTREEDCAQRELGTGLMRKGLGSKEDVKRDTLERNTLVRKEFEREELEKEDLHGVELPCDWSLVGEVHRWGGLLRAAVEGIRADREAHVQWQQQQLHSQSGRVFEVRGGTNTTLHVFSSTTA